MPQHEDNFRDSEDDAQAREHNVDPSNTIETFVSNQARVQSSK